MTPADPPALSPAQTALRFVAVLLATGVTQGLAAAALASALERSDVLRADGLIFSVGLLAGALAGALTLLLLLRGHHPLRYLAFVRPRRLAAWLGLGVLTIVLLDGVTLLLGRPLIPAEWFASFRAANLPLLALALVVVAPLFEESVFRGLLHRGLAASRLGPGGAIAVTTVLFTLAHFPADLAALAQGLVTGALLGAARERTGSLVAPILLHAALNARALVLLSVLPPP